MSPDEAASPAGELGNTFETYPPLIFPSFLLMDGFQALMMSFTQAASNSNLPPEPLKPAPKPAPAPAQTGAFMFNVEGETAKSTRLKETCFHSL